MKNGHILKAALVLALALVMMVGLAVTAHAASVSYIDADGQSRSIDATELNGNEPSLDAGWYVVNGSIAYSQTLYASGDVNLILADGGEMKLANENYGLIGGPVSGSVIDCNLTVYGQSQQTGKLTYPGSDNCMIVAGLTVNGGAISGRIIAEKDMVVNRGTLSADSITAQEKMTINGGDITAGLYPGQLLVKGGAVNGLILANETVAISGGTVTAKAGPEHAIQAPGGVTISGGVVSAVSDSGCGIYSPASDIAITGGQVTATAKATGSYGIQSDGGSITLSLSDKADFIQSSGFSGAAVKVADGRSLKDADGNVYTGALSDAQLSAIAGAKLVAADLAPEAVEIVTLPGASAITVGQPLSQSTLTGGEAQSGGAAVEGTFAWAKPDTVPAASDSQSTEYDVIFTPSDPNYASATCRVKLTVNKLTPSVNPPFAIEGLTYTGQPQALLTAGSAEGGEIQYALGTEQAATEAYSTSVPTGTDVGTYYVWWRVAGDATHADAGPEMCAVTIADAPPEPGPEPEPEPYIYITPVSLDTIYLKQKVQLGVASNDPSLPLLDVKWIVSNRKVLSVSSKGLLIGKKEGETEITAEIRYGNTVVTSAPKKITVLKAEKVHPTGIRFADDIPTQLYVKDRLRIGQYVIVEPANTDIRYRKYQVSIDDVSVLSKNGGESLRARKAGTATITVKIDRTDLSASVKITVLDTPRTDLTGVTLSRPGSGPIFAKEKLQIMAFYTPAKIMPKKTKWTTSNNKVAIVNSVGTVTGTGEGTATITLEADGLTASIDIEVLVPPTSIAFTEDAPTVVGVNNAIYLSSFLSFEPDTAPKDVNWKSSDASVAAVNTRGQVMGIKPGQATITATSKKNKKRSASIVINVIGSEKITLSVAGDPVVQRGNSIYVDAVAEPAGSYAKLLWHSSDEKVATVKNGTVTGKKKGTTTITATDRITGVRGEIEITVEDDKAPTEISFSADAPTVVGVDGKIELKPYVIIAPDTAETKLNWSSSDDKVAKVSSKGVVTGVKKGTAVITAASKDYEAVKGSIEVRVFGVESVELDDIGTMLKGEKAPLVPTYTPEGALPWKVKWKSDDPRVATVNDKGEVTGKRAGTAHITLTVDNDPSICATAEVEVEDPDTIVAMRFAEDAPTAVAVTNTIDLGAQLVVEPDTAERKLQWKSSDDKVAKVDSKGVVTGVKKGAATITAIYKSNKKIFASIEIEVYGITGITISGEDSVEKGEKITLTATCEPAGIATELEWSSDKSRVAKVDKNGVVKGKGGGTAFITVTDQLTGVSDTFQVWVLG